MKQVTQDQFFAHVGPRDVHPAIVTDRYPYTQHWIERPAGRLIGKTVDRYANGKIGLTVTDYYLQED